MKQKFKALGVAISIACAFMLLLELFVKTARKYPDMLASIFTNIVRFVVEYGVWIVLLVIVVGIVCTRISNKKHKDK